MHWKSILTRLKFPTPETTVRPQVMIDADVHVAGRQTGFCHKSISPRRSQQTSALCFTPRLQNTGRASHRIDGERTLTHWLFQTLAMIHTQPLSPVLSTVLKTQPYPWLSTEHEKSMSVKQGQRTLAEIGCWEEDSIEVTMPCHGESGAQDLSGAEAEPESY